LVIALKLAASVWRQTTDDCRHEKAFNMTVMGMKSPKSREEQG